MGNCVGNYYKQYLKLGFITASGNELSPKFWVYYIQSNDTMKPPNLLIIYI